MITVYHLNRSRSLRILWLLEELGLAYEVQRFERDAKTSLAPDSLRAVHPLGKSPMIRNDGQLVSESGAIVDYLCARFGPHMVPAQDTASYVQHLELMHFAEGSVMTPILLNLYVGRLGDAGAPLHPRIQEQLGSHFSYMDSLVRPSGHFVLDDVSAADILLSFPAQIAMRLGGAQDYPNLKRFVDQIEARPAFARALDAAGGD